MRVRYHGAEPVLVTVEGGTVAVQPGQSAWLPRCPDGPDWAPLPWPKPPPVVPRRWHDGPALAAPWVQVVWHTAQPVPWPRWVRRVVLAPEPGHPHGRYGETLWRLVTTDYADAPGLVVVEQDLAGDWRHVTALDAFIRRRPGWVGAVPYRLWTTSTGRGEPIWAHRVAGPDGSWQPVAAIQRCPRRLAAFGLGLTYLPRALLEAIPEWDGPWAYPLTDTTLSHLAQAAGVPARAVGPEAVHLHWGREGG